MLSVVVSEFTVDFIGSDVPSEGLSVELVVAGDDAAAVLGLVSVVVGVNDDGIVTSAGVVFAAGIVLESASSSFAVNVEVESGAGFDRRGSPLAGVEEVAVIGEPATAVVDSVAFSSCKTRAIHKLKPIIH